jgi:hypothetical protein
MRSEAELLYESINSAPAPGFTLAEWGQILTIAQRAVVIDILKEGVTRNTLNALAIEKLLQPDSYTVFTTDTHFKNSDGTAAQTLDTGSKAFDPKYFWIVDEYCETASDTNIALHRRAFDFYRINIENPFRAPNSTDGFWILQYNNNPVFVTDGTAITKYAILGCEHPDLYPIANEVTYGTEGSCLNEGVHSRIVEKAVKIARMSVEDAQGYQLALAEFEK